MTAEWTIEAYCNAQEPSDLTILPATAQAFIQALNLSTIHPFCDGLHAPYDIPGVPRQGPLIHHDHLESIWDVVVTMLAMGVPELAAMAELWLRLFASLLAPLGVAHLVRHELSSSQHSCNTWYTCTAILLSVASSVVLLTDTLYVLEYGAQYGASLLVLSTLLGLRACHRHGLHKTRIAVMCLLLVAIMQSFGLDERGMISLRRSDEHVQIEPGLYYDASNAQIQNFVQKWWPESYRKYNGRASRWMPTGDAKTGLPFLLNHVESPVWTRVWLPVADGEVVALDISFPDGGHDISKPVYLVLHGLNGGSQEEYVKDFAQRRRQQGATVVVMVARGLMDLPIRGWNTFHGARWTDAHCAAQALRFAMAPHQQVLAGVGYSMGAIILGNYVTRSGPDCALDVAVAIAGGLDMRPQADFRRAQRLWQPILTTELRSTFVVGKWGERVRARLTKEEFKSLMRATHITEIDKTAVVAYNGFDDINHYYSEMSALGDVPPTEYASDQLDPTRRIHNVSIPFCVLHSLDDPLVTWRSVAANHGWMHPANLTRTGSGNLVLLLTKSGGHVGWPLGWLPFIDKWRFMNDVAMSFVESVAKQRDADSLEH